MSNIVINGATYKGVPSIQVPNESGEMVEFEETSDIDKILNRTITSYSNDRITQVGACAFQYCSNLYNVSFANVTHFQIYAFSNCTNLLKVISPKIEAFMSYCFYSCSRLTKIDAPVGRVIQANAFLSSGLKTLIFRKNALATLSSSNAFTSTPIASGTGYIYVPSALVDSYKTATNWSVYANQFRALEDYTVDGTITGELDENKI
jgi:hypothetical protein